MKEIDDPFNKELLLITSDYLEDNSDPDWIIYKLAASLVIIPHDPLGQEEACEISEETIKIIKNYSTYSYKILYDAPYGDTPLEYAKNILRKINDNSNLFKDA